MRSYVAQMIVQWIVLITIIYVPQTILQQLHLFYKNKCTNNLKIKNFIVKDEN